MPNNTSSIKNKLHTPVLLKETVEALNLDKESHIIVDCTFGAGGHTREVLIKYPTVKVISIDRDESVRGIADEVQSEFKDRFYFAVDRFSNIDKVVKSFGFKEVDGIIYDFGFSSMQIENPERGFSFQNEGLLSMQMGLNSISAYDVVNLYPEEKLADILFYYGDEIYSRRVARAIVKHRNTSAIKTTTELSNIIADIIPYKKYNPNAIHPATKSFQAIRIEVNKELEEIETSLDNAFNLLKVGGRICAISFHSLEDRLIKRFINSVNLDSISNFDRNNPDTWQNKGSIPKRALQLKKVFPSKDEIYQNKRSRSAKLRIIEKLS